MILRRARALAGTAPDLPLDDLEPLRPVVRDAVVVGLGEATRFAHDVFAMRERLLRFLVERMGFGVLALEVGPDVGERLDAWVRGGAGAPEPILDDAWEVWRTEEFLALLHRLRAGGDVRIAGIDVAVRGVSAYHPSEGADRVEAVHERTGDRVVYWGGTGHTAVHDPAPGFPPHPFPRTEGTFLRERLGRGYASVGVTFGRGLAGWEVAPASPELAESALAGADAPLLLDLGEPFPDSWAGVPTRTRVIGPDYDAARDAEFAIAGTPLRVLFDALVHLPVVGPVTRLPSGAARAAGPGSR